MAHARAGRRTEAWQVYAEQERRHGAKGAYALAVIAANLGDVERALHWLEVERRSGQTLSGLQRDPWLAPVRSDPRFQEFVRRVETP